MELQKFGGDARAKKPDACITKDDDEDNHEIVVEVEYAHLPVAGLLEKSIILLTELKTPQYVIAVKIFANQLEFRCVIFVLERLESNAFNPDKLKQIQILLDETVGEILMHSPGGFLGN